MSSQSKLSPCDYDVSPNRFRQNVEATRGYGLGDVHEEVAERLADLKMEPFLDLGCGEGRLVHPLRQKGVNVIAFDYSATMLSSLSGQCVRGDATALPFGTGLFGAVAALYMLYHIARPEDALRESRRVHCRDGLFITCAPSRYNDPELAELLPYYGEPATFDAENGPDLVAEQFVIMEIQQWDAPLMQLPDHEALALYLAGRGLITAHIERAVSTIHTPLALTKRGMVLFAKKR